MLLVGHMILLSFFSDPTSNFFVRFLQESATRMSGKPVHHKEPVNIGYAFKIMPLLLYIFILIKPLYNNCTGICSNFYNTNDLLIVKYFNEITSGNSKSDRQ